MHMRTPKQGTTLNRENVYINLIGAVEGENTKVDGLAILQG